MDHETIANTALKTKFNKDRILSENEHVLTATSKELAANLLALEPTGTPGSKVQSRLLSSKILALEIAAVVEDLRNVLQPKPDPNTETPEEDAGAERTKRLNKLGDFKDKNLRVISLDHLEGQEDDVELQPDIGGVDETGWESGTVEDDEHEEDGWESGSLAGEGDELVEEGEDLDSNDEELAIAPPTTNPSKKPVASAKAVPTKAPPKTTGLQSTFLPSLSVGFIRGGSDDSEMSENEAKLADIDLKKNRRGQRARRA
jgi:hypothetical protein